MRVLVEFARADALLAAARAARAANCEVVDGYSPLPVAGLPELLGNRPSGIRVAMFVGGFTVAACAYALEWWSAVENYPIDSGGRPLHSWPAFMMFPFSVGILSAAVCGFIAFLLRSGLPRLHHPVFGIEGFERASQDRFALELVLPEGEDAYRRLLDALRGAGAVAVREVQT